MMTVSEPMKRLLGELGYSVGKFSDLDTSWEYEETPWLCEYPSGEGTQHGTGDDAWTACLAHAESEAGLAANFPKVVRLLAERAEDDARIPLGWWICDNPPAEGWALLKEVHGA